MGRLVALCEAHAGDLGPIVGCGGPPEGPAHDDLELCETRARGLPVRSKSFTSILDMRQLDGVSWQRLESTAPAPSFPPLRAVLDEDQEALVVPRQQRPQNQGDVEMTAGEYSRTVVSQ